MKKRKEETVGERAPLGQRRERQEQSGKIMERAGLFFVVQCSFSSLAISFLGRRLFLRKKGARCLRFGFWERFLFQKKGTGCLRVVF